MMDNEIVSINIHFDSPEEEVLENDAMEEYMEALQVRKRQLQYHYVIECLWAILPVFLGVGIGIIIIIGLSYLYTIYNL